MKLKLKQYTEPLTIEVERPDGTTDAVELTLNLSDTNVLRSEKAARKIVEAANGMTGEDYERQTRELGRLVADAIDVVAGEGAAEKIVSAFGVEGAAEKIVAVESSPHMRGALGGERRADRAAVPTIVRGDHSPRCIFSRCFSDSRSK